MPNQQQQQPNSHGEAVAAGEMSSLPNLLVESGDLTQGKNSYSAVAATEINE